MRQSGSRRSRAGVQHPRLGHHRHLPHPGRRRRWGDVRHGQQIPRIVFRGRAQAALVVVGYLDGGHDVRGRHAAGRLGHGGRAWDRRELVLVGLGDLERLPRGDLRLAVAPGRGDHRRRVGRDALHRQERHRTPRVQGDVLFGDDQRHRARMGDPGDVQDRRSVRALAGLARAEPL